MNRRCRIPILVLLVAQLGACVSWQTVNTSPVALLEDGGVERMRVTRTDGAPLTLEAPQIRAGALVATASPGAVLVEEVSQVEIEGVSVLRTIALVLPAAELLAVVGKASCRC